ncbi:MAG: ArsR family transcriptional regulator [Nitrospirae bacterium]|nr:MAG: ArsR family transcriptional regulator [Nitrospirota bacterium]
MIRSTGKRIELLRIIAHPVRMRILYELMRGPQCVTDLVDFLEVNQSNVSQHLALLRQSGAVECRTDGRTKWYYVLDPIIPDIVAVLKRDYAEDFPPPTIPVRKMLHQVPREQPE